MFHGASKRSVYASSYVQATALLGFQLRPLALFCVCLGLRSLRVYDFRGYSGSRAELSFRGLGLQFVPMLLIPILDCGETCRRTKASAAEEAS